MTNSPLNNWMKKELDKAFKEETLESIIYKGDKHKKRDREAEVGCGIIFAVFLVLGLALVIFKLVY